MCLVAGAKSTLQVDASGSLSLRWVVKPMRGSTHSISCKKQGLCGTTAVLEGAHPLHDLMWITMRQMSTLAYRS